VGVGSIKNMDRAGQQVDGKDRGGNGAAQRWHGLVQGGAGGIGEPFKSSNGGPMSRLSR